MKTPVVLLANGEQPKNPKTLDFINNASSIICADGGYELAKLINVQPTVIIGDFDSTDPNHAALQDNSLIKIIKAEDQNKSDLEKAIEYCISVNIDLITLIAATGKRDDHTLANFLLMIDYFEQIEIQIMTDYYLINVVKGEKKYHASVNTQISLVSFEVENFITTQGLKFNLNREKLKSSTHGISNSTVHEQFSVFSEKPLILFRKI